ncbi:MAG: hypothetical protein II818_01385 [Aeriscardovia sp.]|nr:hypothetical protein [Aeriscardovia sp.]
MQGQSETAKGLDAAQEAYDTVKDRASLTHESIDPTDICNLKPNCTAAGSEYGRPAEERKVSRGEYQKAKDAVKKALDEKS